MKRGKRKKEKKKKKKNPHYPAPRPENRNRAPTSVRRGGGPARRGLGTPAWTRRAAGRHRRRMASLFEKEADRDADLACWDGQNEWASAQGFERHCDRSEVNLGERISEVQRSKRHARPSDESRDLMRAFQDRKRRRQLRRQEEVRKQAEVARTARESLVRLLQGQAEGDVEARCAELSLSAKRRQRVLPQLERVLRDALRADASLGGAFRPGEEGGAARDGPEGLARRLEGQVVLLCGGKEDYRRLMDAAFGAVVAVKNGAAGAGPRGPRQTRMDAFMSKRGPGP